ncbi:MAG TPA: Crp/Fnr family transcriptional regulator [Alphaproteobacteria bacterium]|jgi:CRP-like cAMP-binding protein|nr:Crp/Fnr family transcriptional regulator [Alphaproteobacteria bacterium]
MSLLEWLPASVGKATSVRTVAANAALFHRGDKATAIFEVECGQIRLVRHTIGSHAIILHTARDGELFAEAALYADIYHCDAVAITDCGLRVYPKRQLLDAFRADPALAERFSALLAHQIHALRTRVEELHIRSARGRVLHYLSRTAGPDERTITLHGTLMDFAAEIGLSHEVLYRTLAALEREGVIRRTRSQIVLRKNPPI